MDKSFKKLGKLSLAILEHFVEDKLGKKFADELRAPTQRTLAVATALERTQDRFVKEFEDKIFSEKIFSEIGELSFSLLGEEVGKFYDHPTDADFPKALQTLIVTDFPYFPINRVEQGVAEYITLLTEELVQVDETFRQNASAIATVRGERWQKQILRTLSENQQKGNFYKGNLTAYLPSGAEITIEKIRESSRTFQTNNINKYCTDYLQHSLDHPDRAISILNNWLLDEEQKQHLANNNWTLFFLYAAIYIYNIGLSIPKSLEINDLAINSRNDILKLRPQLGKLVVEKYGNDLGIEDNTQANILATILSLQTTSLEEVKIKRRIPYKQTGQSINLQFVVGCLKLLHELDLHEDRILYLLERFLPNEHSLSNTFELEGIGPHGNYTDTINASIHCRSINVHRAFKSLEGYTQSTLSEINRNINPRFRFTQVMYDIENIGYDPIDYKFKVEASAALEVFMGTPIYTQKATFLRELIQNSLDACNVKRMYHTSYKPKISVERKSDFKTVIVKDNGIGMDQTWVEKYFLPVGISFYRSDEFENIAGLDVGFSPISRFGIGILSCFMVADKVVIRTKKQDTVGLEMTISDFKNYFDVKQDTSLEQGTEIILTLKQEFAEIDCLGYLLKNIKFTQYPIEYIYFDGESRIIGQEPISLVEKLKVDFWKRDWEGFIEEPIVFSSQRSEGYIAFSRDKSSSDKIISGNMSVCEVNVFQDGIFICNEPYLLPRWITKNIVSRVNLKDDDRVDISISRVGLLQNSKYKKLKSKISEGLSRVIDDILKITLSHLKNRKNYVRFVKEFINHNININAIDDNLVRILTKNYCFTVYKHTNQVDGYYLYEELPDKKRISYQPKSKGQNKEKVYLGTKGNFVADMDARILLRLDPDKRYALTSSLSYKNDFTIEQNEDVE